mmetsp:Transcript_159201/g.487156  ORF Transcript_159201/g.487156 Transcript_159201/m.487156 type:complete len:206 (+) Transcript_159201:86-703(+)
MEATVAHWPGLVLAALSVPLALPTPVQMWLPWTPACTASTWTPGWFRLHPLRGSSLCRQRRSRSESCSCTTRKPHWPIGSSAGASAPRRSSARRWPRWSAARCGGTGSGAPSAGRPPRCARRAGDCTNELANCFFSSSSSSTSRRRRPAPQAALVQRRCQPQPSRPHRGAPGAAGAAPATMRHRSGSRARRWTRSSAASGLPARR